MNAQEASKIACDKIYEDNKEFIDETMGIIKQSASTGSDFINIDVITCNYSNAYKIQYYFKKQGYNMNIFDNGLEINW